MLKIISRPPFDDFSMNLFFGLYSKKNQYDLGNALFLYMWTGPISFQTGYYINHQKIQKHKYHDMGVYFNKSTNSLKIAGDKRFFNDKEEVFIDYLSTCGLHDLTDEEMIDMREEFYKLYENYSTQTFNVPETEKLLSDIISDNSKDTIVFFIKDHFRTGFDKSWTDPIPEFSRYFANMCDFFSEKTFIIVTSLENLDKEIDRPNLTIINMGGDITNQNKQYREHAPDVYKNIETSKNFISLNRGPRYHRTYLVASLFARNLDEYGQISFLSIPDNLPLTQLMIYDYQKDVNYQKACEGMVRYHAVSHIVNEDYYDIYPSHVPNDNLTNFKKNLQHKYHNSYIEFVSETSYNEASFNLTEKTLHFVYGCNYPIMIASPGTVKFLREIGVDMFDDFIDHSYDDILDPADRINAAIDRNIGVLTMDKERLHEKWKSDTIRFEQNLVFMRNKLTTFYQDRFWAQITEWSNKRLDE